MVSARAGPTEAVGSVGSCSPVVTRRPTVVGTTTVVSHSRGPSTLTSARSRGEDDRVLRDVRTHIEVLDRDRCLELLAAGSVGRVAVIAGREPVIFPVNYALHDGRIVFRTAPGTKLQSVDWGTRASFEIDDLDPAAREGWSVVAVGPADEIRVGAGGRPGGRGHGPADVGARRARPLDRGHA